MPRNRGYAGAEVWFVNGARDIWIETESVSRYDKGVSFATCNNSYGHQEHFMINCIDKAIYQLQNNRSYKKIDLSMVSSAGIVFRPCQRYYW